MQPRYSSDHIGPSHDAAQVQEGCRTRRSEVSEEVLADVPEEIVMVSTKNPDVPGEIVVVSTESPDGPG